MGINNIELFVIGKRINRKKIICINLIGIFLGIALGIYLNSLIISFLGGTFASIILIFIFKSYYWVITPNGIFTPVNKGFFKYLLIVYQYMFLNEDKNTLIFIKYKDIKKLMLFLNNNCLKIQVFLKNNTNIVLNILKTEFNLDLINAINYINNKGIKVNNIDVLKKIVIKNTLK